MSTIEKKWIETHGPLSGTTIHSTPSRWQVHQWPPTVSIVERLDKLERRVARLETMQRRKPRRRAGRR